MTGMPQLFIGLMSGTSLDGVDGVLCDFGDRSSSALRVLSHAHRPFPDELRAELLALNSSGEAELHRAALASNALVRTYADVVAQLLAHVGLAAADVRAVGAHGQTLRHRPGEFDGIGYTLQLNNPALLAELAGIDVVADFRTRDVAAGGQGAPLVPAFHASFFGRPGRTVAVLNLGGIANLTAVRADGTVAGFDTGPANALMDHWCQRHRGEPFDRGGSWAASGKVDAALLGSLRAEPFFAQPPPKSTGRDLFNAPWLDRHLQAHPEVQPEDVQATLAEVTAWSAAEAVRQHAPGANELLVCGGGAHNQHLMKRLAALLPGVAVVATDTRGLPANQVESVAFAWLAKAFTDRQPGNLPAVTGARGPRILGALYPHA